jgi:hypothetical protein
MLNFGWLQKWLEIGLIAMSQPPVLDFMEGSMKNLVKKSAFLMAVAALQAQDQPQSTPEGIPMGSCLVWHRVTEVTVNGQTMKTQSWTITGVNFTLTTEDGNFAWEMITSSCCAPSTASS